MEHNKKFIFNSYKSKFDSNVWNRLSQNTKDALYEIILNTIENVIKKKRIKYYPTVELIEILVGSEIQRLVAALDNALEGYGVRRKYLLIYSGYRAKKLYKIVEAECSNLVEIKSLIEKSKPSWALRCNALLLAVHLEEDLCYPVVMHWPTMEKPVSERIKREREHFRFGYPK